MPVFASPVPAEMILFDVLAGSFLFPHEVVIVLDTQPEVEHGRFRTVTGLSAFTCTAANFANAHGARSW